MSSTQSYCSCSHSSKSSVQNDPFNVDGSHTPFWLAENDFDAASASMRKQRARLEKQRKRRLAKQQRRKRRKSRGTTVKRLLTSPRKFLLGKAYATKVEMVQAIRQLETGMKSSLPGNPLPANHRLNTLQRRGLMENVRLVLIKANERIRRGETPQAVLNTLRIQRRNPRFRFIRQIPSANAALQNTMRNLRRRGHQRFDSSDGFLQDSFKEGDDIGSSADGLGDFAGPPRPKARPPRVSLPRQQLLAVHNFIHQALLSMKTGGVVFSEQKYISPLREADKTVQQLRTYIASLRISPRPEHKRDLPRTLNLLDAIRRYIRIARGVGISSSQDIKSSLMTAKRAALALLEGSVFFHQS